MHTRLPTPLNHTASVSSQDGNLLLETSVVSADARSNVLTSSFQALRTRISQRHRQGRRLGCTLLAAALPWTSPTFEPFRLQTVSAQSCCHLQAPTFSARGCSLCWLDHSPLVVVPVQVSTPPPPSSTYAGTTSSLDSHTPEYCIFLLQFSAAQLPLHI